MEPESWTMFICMLLARHGATPGLSLRQWLIIHQNGRLEASKWAKDLCLQNWVEIKMLPKFGSLNTRLSQLPVSGSGEKCTAPEPRQVCPSRAPTLTLKVVQVFLLHPKGDACWARLVKGCRSRVAEKFFNWSLTILGFWPWTLDEPLFVAPLLAQQAAMSDCHAPWSTSNKRWVRWERGARLTFKIDKGVFVA